MAVSGACPFICTRKLTLHALLTLILIATHAVQGVILNLFFIMASRHSILPYFWFVADFLVVLFFAMTMIRSYRHWKKADGKHVKRKSFAKLSESRRSPSIFRRYILLLGEHPMSYISWLLYSLLLVLKITLIFKMELVNQLDPDSFLGPQVMKMALALTAFAFFIFVEGHYDAARNTDRALYIAGLVKGNAFEVFDSITFLSLLFVAETGMLFSFAYENAIIVFGCITLLLPNFCLYKLSHNDYGLIKTNVTMSFVYKMLHLFLVNIPYMIVRIYLWSTMGQEVSIFLVKNVLHIILALLDCSTDIQTIRARWLSQNSKTKNNVTNTTNLSNSGAPDINLSPLSKDTEEFEDVDLSNDKSSTTADSRTVTERMV